MPRVSTEITPRIAELLQAGIINISTSWYASGSETYARCSQNHPKLGIRAHESFKLDEIQVLLEKVRVPTLYSAPMDVGPASAGSTPVKRGQAITVSVANVPEIGNVPTGVVVNGVHNTLPKSSISYKDLVYLSDDQLTRRIQSVGKEMGPDKAVSRISSDSFLSATTEPTLFKWWNSANVEQRLSLVSNSKFLGKLPPGQNREDLLARLTTGRYPFRNTDRKMEEVYESEEEEIEGGLTIDFDDLSI
jgi:hypothetical protein